MVFELFQESRFVVKILLPEKTVVKLTQPAVKCLQRLTDDKYSVRHYCE